MIFLKSGSRPRDSCDKLSQSSKMNTEMLLEKTFKKFNKKIKKPKKKPIFKMINKKAKHEDAKLVLHHTLTAPASGAFISKKSLKDKLSPKQALS